MPISVQRPRLRLAAIGTLVAIAGCARYEKQTIGLTPISCFPTPSDTATEREVHALTGTDEGV